MKATTNLDPRGFPAIVKAKEMESTETPGDPPAQIVPVMQRSWVTVAKQQKGLKSYDLEISVLEGKQSVNVPSEIVEKANPLWDDFVIARFLETAPHVAKVHMILNKIWMFGEKSMKIDVYEMDAVTMRIRVPSDAIRGKIIRRGVWNIAGIPMVVSKWSPVVDKSEGQLTPLWVHLSNVPMSMYSWEGLSFISSAVGKPDRLHPETIACSNFEIAKVCVKADLSKQLPERMNFKIGDEEVIVEFAYQGLPTKCRSCGKWGHSDIICSMKKEEGEIHEVELSEGKRSQEKDVEEGGDGNGKEVEVVKDLEVGKDMEKERNLQDTRVMEVVEIVTEVEKTIEKSGVQEGNGSGKLNESWRQVAEKTIRSPWKSPKELQFGQVTITPSRYAALQNLEDSREEDTSEPSEDVVEEGNGIEKPKVVESEGGRQILPRNSKTFHKVLSETVISRSEIGVTTRGSKKHH